MFLFFLGICLGVELLGLCFVCLFFILFIFDYAVSSLLRAGFLLLQRAGATLPCGAEASHLGGFSCCGTQPLGPWASVVVARSLLGSGEQAQ